MTATPSQETPPVWASYLDLAQDVKPWLQIDTGTASYDTKLQMVTEMACEWVQGYLGRPVAPTTFFRRFTGWGLGMNGAVIELPYYPVLQVISVTEYWGANGVHVLSEQTPANQTAQDCYQMDYLRGHIIRAFMGLQQRPWFPASRNIEIEWQAGYNPIPRTLKVATLELVQWWWRNTQEAPRTSTIQTIGYEDAPATGGLWPAVPQRISALLEPYVQQGMG